MPSADSCAPVRSPRGFLSSDWNRTQASPGKFDRLHRTPPDLQSWPLMELDFAISGPLVRTKNASYPISVRRVAVLLRTSFRRQLAMAPLCFASPSPPSGWTGDFHPPAIEHAGHTTKSLRDRSAAEAARLFASPAVADRTIRNPAPKTRKPHLHHHDFEWRTPCNRRCGVHLDGQVETVSVG